MPKPVQTVSASQIRLDPDTHRVIKIGGSTHKILSHLAYNPDRAIAELAAGRGCMLNDAPGNLDKVRAAFAKIFANQTEVPNG